jgi:hypothetical protein
MPLKPSAPGSEMKGWTENKTTKIEQQQQQKTHPKPKKQTKQKSGISSSLLWLLIL